MKKEISSLAILDQMVKDNNQGILLSNTIADVKEDSRGVIVGFGIESKVGQSAIFQHKMGLPSDYMFMCFAVKRSEFDKTKAKLRVVDTDDNKGKSPDCIHCFVFKNTDEWWEEEGINTRSYHRVDHYFCQLCLHEKKVEKNHFCYDSEVYNIPDWAKTISMKVRKWK